MPRNTSGLKPFQKGVSGNPGGKPKRLPVTDILIEKLQEKCAQDKQGRTWGELLVAALLSKAVKGDVRAITELIDRAEGKARSRAEVSGPDGGPIAIEIPATRDELERRIAELMAIGKRGQRAAKNPGS